MAWRGAALGAGLAAALLMRYALDWPLKKMPQNPRLYV
jgi:hypothetical protein